MERAIGCTEICAGYWEEHLQVDLGAVAAPQHEILFCVWAAFTSCLAGKYATVLSHDDLNLEGTC